MTRFVRALSVSGTYRVGAGDAPATDHLVDHLAPEGRLVAQQHEGGGAALGCGGCHPGQSGGEAQRHALICACGVNDDGAGLLSQPRFLAVGFADNEKDRAQGAATGAGRHGVEHACEQRTSLKRREQLLTAEPAGTTRCQDNREDRRYGRHAGQR